MDGSFICLLLFKSKLSYEIICIINFSKIIFEEIDSSILLIFLNENLSNLLGEYKNDIREAQDRRDDGWGIVGGFLLTSTCTKLVIVLGSLASLGSSTPNPNDLFLFLTWKRTFKNTLPIIISEFQQNVSCPMITSEHCDY